MRKLLFIGVGLIAVFVAACVYVVYAVTRPEDGSSWKRRAPESATSAAPDQAQSLVLRPDPTIAAAPPPRQLSVPGYGPGTSLIGGQAAAAPAAPKEPFDPVAREQKRREKREMMNRRRDGPPARSAEDLE